MVINGRAICGVFEIEGARIRAWPEYFDLAPGKAAYDRP